MKHNRQIIYPYYYNNNNNNNDIPYYIEPNFTDEVINNNPDYQQFLLLLEYCIKNDRRNTYHNILEFIHSNPYITIDDLLSILSQKKYID